jgi:hypothetical protein
MTTTRVDHTNCSHTRNAKGRAWCRANRRNKIREAQKMYDAVQLDPNFAGQSEYEATVDLFAMDYGMDLRDAYDLIERGPIII